MSNFVYIATSIDGYISAPDGGLEWLNYIPAPEGDDLGFADHVDFANGSPSENVEVAKQKGFESKSHRVGAFIAF